jgi:hypothetical protein
MIGLFCFVLAVLASPFKSKMRLEAENAVPVGATSNASSSESRPCANARASRAGRS